MAHLPYLDAATAAPAVAETLDALPDLHLFEMVAHAQSAFRPWLEFGGALLATLELDPILRELAILHVAQLAGSDYERVQHTAIGAAVGVTTDQIAALASGQLHTSSFTPLQAKVLAFTAAAVQANRVPAPIVTSLAREIGPRQVVELLLVIGYYLGVALLAESVGLDPDQPAQMAVVDIAQAQTAP